MRGRPLGLAVLVVVLALVGWLGAGDAGAHGFRPGMLRLGEIAPGTFELQWIAPLDTGYGRGDVRPAFPPPCARRGDTLECGPAGLSGELEFERLELQRAPVAVTIAFADGRIQAATVWPSQPVLGIGGSATTTPWRWVQTGAEHVLAGADHIAFLLGLLLVVGLSGARRLVMTVTAFTVAHAFSLVAVALGWLELSPAPVEVAIALSVVLVAREGLRGSEEPPTATQRWPWLAAAGFGLVHGLGFGASFAAAAPEPGGVFWRAVLFSTGVEFGQLALLVGAALVVRFAPAWLGRGRAALAYALGCAAAFWTLERAAAMVTGWL